MVTRLRYGNTNTFFLRGEKGGLLVDTDWAGTLRPFFRAIKAAGVETRDITHVMATHYHPDHAGLLGQLQELGVRVVILAEQRAHIRFPEAIYKKAGISDYLPLREEDALVLPCEKSRAFLRELGISGEIISTPSHSPDSVSVVLDEGDCIVGDLEPLSYLGGYDDNPALARDWQRVLSFQPKRILYAHANEQTL